MKLLAFAGSNSSSSINKRFVTYASALLDDHRSVLPDLNEYEVPIYSSDREKTNGIPQLVMDFKDLIKDADKVMISLAEHNSSYSAAFKNIMDWLSRIEGKTWENKPFFLLSTSPGGRGASTVLSIAATSFVYMGAQVISHFSLPHFHKNFDDEKGILDDDLNRKFMTQLDKFRIIA